jgi:hypothetical protein
MYTVFRLLQYVNVHQNLVVNLQYWLRPEIHILVHQSKPPKTHKKVCTLYISGSQLLITV